MYKDVHYNKYTDLVLEQLKTNGAFLTARGERTNTMTVGWGQIGVMWGKPVFMVPVRHSRFTHKLIEDRKEFTISVPFSTHKKELAGCGAKSGRDLDKFKQFQLTAIPGKVIDTPVIAGCKVYYECKVVFQQEMDASVLLPEYNKIWYGNNDYHTLYFGEIIACYLDE